MDAGKTSIVHTFVSNSGNVFYSHLKNDSFEIIKNNEDETIPQDSNEGGCIINLIAIREHIEVYGEDGFTLGGSVKKATVKKAKTL